MTDSINIELTYADTVNIQMIADRQNITFSQARDVYFSRQKFEQMREERKND